VTELAKRQLEVEAALKEKRAMEQRVRDLEVQDQCYSVVRGSSWFSLFNLMVGHTDLGRAACGRVCWLPGGHGARTHAMAEGA
jgi:hypothetical protein